MVSKDGRGRRRTAEQRSPSKVVPSSRGEPTPKTHPDSGPRGDGGGVPDRGKASPKPLTEYAPDTLNINI
ncbi:hypothetical protein HanPSC8_Chr06g0242031 [Helianthus annuus]|nr:hypothetical protein HanPSC8_Chr06g0242031 [Helianthus annuus]